MYRDAAEHLDFVMRNAPADTPAAEQKLVQDMFNEARSHIGEFIVEVNAEGAEIFVDGSSVGKAPLQSSVFVEPGPRIVEAKLDGYPNARQSADVKPGSAQMTIRLRLEKPSASGIVPPKDLNEESGKPNKAVLLAGWSTVGVGMIVTAVSAGFAISYRGQAYDFWDEHVGKCQTYPGGPDACQTDYDALRKGWATSGNVAINAGVLTGLGAAAVLTYMLWPRSKPSSDKFGEVKVNASLQPGSGWAGVTMPW